MRVALSVFSGPFAESILSAAKGSGQALRTALRHDIPNCRSNVVISDERVDRDRLGHLTIWGRGVTKRAGGAAV